MASSFDVLSHLSPLITSSHSVQPLTLTSNYAGPLSSDEKANLLSPECAIDVGQDEDDEHADLPYAIVNIEGKGEGVVATRDLAPGDFIASERAQLKWRASEKSFYRLEWMLSKLSPEDREKFHKLHNCYTEEDLGHYGTAPPEIIGKWQTNAFGTDDDHQVVYLNVITKLNHACRNNVSRHWCPQEETMTIRASDYIRKGEELTFSYVSQFNSCENRRFHAILGWGFLCNCELCSLPPEQLKISDERRLRLNRLRTMELQQSLPPEIRMRYLKESIDLLYAEGLYEHLSVYSVECVELCAELCAELDLQEETSAWAAIAAEQLRLVAGPTDEKVLFLNRCVGQPWLYREKMLREEGWIKKAQRLAHGLLKNIWTLAMYE